MAVARTHHNKNYTCMSNYHFQDRQLSLKAKGLLSLMLSLPDTWDYSISGLASLSSDGETSVRSAVKELEEYNYLKRTPIREGGRIIDWEYDIYETPTELLLVENPQVESPPLENTDNKVLTQVNTNKKNKNIEFSFGGKPAEKKPNLFTKCINLIDDYPFCQDVRELLVEYLQFRIAVKDKPLYANMWKGMLSKLQELIDDHGHLDNKLCRAIIKQSIERGYLSFYPISNGSGFSKSVAWESGVSSEQYTDEELEKLEEEGGGEWF